MTNILTGCQSDVGRLQSVVIKHARNAFQNPATVERQWRELNYLESPNFADASAEYDAFVSLLEGFGIKMHFLPEDDTLSIDSMYVRDASIVCERGMILCGMGKEARKGEPAAHEAAFNEWGIPVLGRIGGGGRVEGGDVAWIDDRTIAVGRGYRTNDDGIHQLRELLADRIDELIVAALPHYRGVNDVFHLMSIFSPIDRDLALVYSPLMPVTFREALLSRGIALVEVPDEEFDSMGCNVLAVGPRECIALAGNPVTRQRLEFAGATVHEMVGREICAKGCGGPTCLTRPLARTPTD